MVIQYTEGPRFGEYDEILSIEQDPNTYKDFVVFTNGSRIPHNNIGYILCQDSQSILDEVSLSLYRSEMSGNVVNNTNNIPLNKQVTESFEQSMYKKCKKEEFNLNVELSNIELPTKDFMNFVKNAFDTNVEDEMYNIMISSLNIEDIKNIIKNSIKKIY